MFQDKLLNKLEENEPELATSPEEEVSSAAHRSLSIFYFISRIEVFIRLKKQMHEHKQILLTSWRVMVLLLNFILAHEQR